MNTRNKKYDGKHGVQITFRNSQNEKRCKDCVRYKHCVCLEKILEMPPIPADFCGSYKRKWWKIWRKK